MWWQQWAWPQRVWEKWQPWASNPAQCITWQPCKCLLSSRFSTKYSTSSCLLSPSKLWSIYRGPPSQSSSGTGLKSHSWVWTLSGSIPDADASLPSEQWSQQPSEWPHPPWQKSTGAHWQPPAIGWASQMANVVLPGRFWSYHPALGSGVQACKILP